MIALGWFVGHGATAFDTWFVHTVHKWVHYEWHLLPLSDPVVLGVLMAVCLAYVVRRKQYRLASILLISPVVAYYAAEAVKPIFNRRINGVLSYPSGHATLVVTIAGLILLVVGFRRTTAAFAAVLCLLAMTALGCTVHYFTDTVGGALLGSAVASVAALLARGQNRSAGPNAIDSNTNA